jgi:uracil-DNA glycosylase family 4
MSSAYHELLEATIKHLEDLKGHGSQFVSVSRETLDSLSRKPLVGAPRVGPPRAAAVVAPLGSHPAAAPVALPPEHKRIEPKPAETAVSQAAPATVDARPASTAALSPEAKTSAFAELSQRASVCIKCPHLVKSRKQVVFGVGDINAQLMFVGEAPGADEDEQGEPFVGKAGQLLTKIIETMGLSRDSVYIANILKCRPDTPGQASGNRKPTPEEMQICIPYLHSQIDLIQPKIIVGLGGTALEGLQGKPVFITKLRGQWQSYRGIPLMPTYHPAYVLRNQGLSMKREVWEDMLQVMQHLGMPISEKQQRFFLKAA